MILGHLTSYLTLGKLILFVFKCVLFSSLCTCAHSLLLKETKVHSLQDLHKLQFVNGWESFWNVCKAVGGKEKKGYSGVVTYVKSGITPSASVRFGIDEFDEEGRIVMTDHQAFVLFNVYLPNSGQDKKRLDYKLRFNNWFRSKCDDLIQAGRPVVVVGDFNVARSMDIHPTLVTFPKLPGDLLCNNVRTIGFIPTSGNSMDG